MADQDNTELSLGVSKPAKYRQPVRPVHLVSMLRGVQADSLAHLVRTLKIARWIQDRPLQNRSACILTYV